MPAGAAPARLPPHPARYIERLLCINDERKEQIEILKTQLEQQTELCKLAADRAARAEANAAAARAEAHKNLLKRQLEGPAPSAASLGLSSADLAALNALPPAERDAAWLRHVFVPGPHAGAPLGPHELAGLYMDAFFWTGTATSQNAIVGTVARVFPGIQLVETERGSRFRGLARAQDASADTDSRDRQARLSRTERSAAAPDVHASKAEALSSSESRPTTPRPTAAPTAKRKCSPEPEPDPAPEASTIKRARMAQSGTVKYEDPLGAYAAGRVLHDAGTNPLRIRTPETARIPIATELARPAVSIGTQTLPAHKAYADAEVQACDRNPVLPPQFQDKVDPDPRDRDTLLASLQRLPPASIPLDLPPLRVPRDIAHTALHDRPIRVVSNLQRGEHGRDEPEQETFREEGEHLEYLGTYIFRPQVCVGYSLDVHDALERAVLEEEVRILSRSGVGDSDSEDGEGWWTEQWTAYTRPSRCVRR